MRHHKKVCVDGVASRAQQGVMEVPLGRVFPASGAGDGKLPVGSFVKDPQKRSVREGLQRGI